MNHRACLHHPRRLRAFSALAGGVLALHCGPSNDDESTVHATQAVSLAPCGTSVHVAAGATAPLTATDGQVWDADKSFSGGVAVTQNPSIAVAGTSDPQLFNSERYDENGFSYDFALPDGNYALTLRFAESFVTSAQQRLFGVAVGGQEVLHEFDIFAAAGGMNRAVDRTFTVAATGGHLRVDFEKGSIQNPKVDAIAITSTGASPPPPTTVGPQPVVAPLPNASPGAWQEGSEGGMTYALLQPEGFSTSTSYPVMLFLHQLQNDAQIPAQIDPWFNSSDFRRRFPAFIVAPRCPNSGESNNWGGVSAESQQCGDQAIAILRKVISTNPTITTRVYITGDSMGGIGTWDLIIRYPDIFAAALPLAGATYDHDVNQSADLLKGFPIWAIHGQNDDQVPLAWDRSIYARMQSIGGIMKYTELPGYGHDVWDDSYPNYDYMQWLFSQQR